MQQVLGTVSRLAQQNLVVCKTSCDAYECDWESTSQLLLALRKPDQYSERTFLQPSTGHARL